jgi:hypothetical protein
MATDYTKMPLLKKIQEALKHEEIIGIKKVANKNLGYSVMNAEDVIDGCRKAMREIGIIMNITFQDMNITHDRYEKTNLSGKTSITHYFILQGKAIFYNADDKTDFIESVFYGSAEDVSDKAIGKANTYAKKIALMNMFLIQDGEDTDSVKSEAGQIKDSPAFLSFKEKLIECVDKQSLEEIAGELKTTKLSNGELHTLRKLYTDVKSKL